MRNSPNLVAFLVALLILALSPSELHAQLAGTDLAPGDSCTGSPTGAKATNADGSGTGNMITLICNGTTWQLARIPGGTVVNTTSEACTATINGAIRHNTTVPCHQICIGTAWVCTGAFVDVTTCTDNQALVFDNATKQIRCGAVDTIDPIWITSAGTIATTDVNLAISEAVAASDESGTPTYQKVSGAGWLNVSTTGTVSGKAPLAGGTYSIVVRAADAAGNTADRTFDVVVNNGSGPVGCVNPGDICPDFTIYAGQSPDGDANYFTTQANLPGTYRFNDGTSNWFDSTITNCENVESTCRTGQANTNSMMVADSATTTGGIDPHNAARACFCLGETHTNAPDGIVPSECSGDPQGTNALEGYGYDDWYLPSIAELDVMYVNLASPGDTDNPTYQDGVGGGGLVNASNDGPAAGSFGTGSYWSSSERFNDVAWRLSFNDGSQSFNSKDNDNNVRCVRR